MRDKLIEEIRLMEQLFAEKVKSDGMKEAFMQFASEEAVISRNNRVFKGKKEIEAYFNSIDLQEIELQWKPDFIDVSESGDMAYSYGSYTFSAKSQKGEKMNSTGIFHTVWKRQSDGSWKYVWD